MFKQIIYLIDGICSIAYTVKVIIDDFFQED